MFQLYVIPTGEDQAAFESGKKPENVLNREFATSEECGEYKNGLEAVFDLAEYSIEDETPTSLTILFDESDEQTYDFDSEEEKDAYKRGLEDGDGFKSPLIIDKDDDPEKFASLELLLRA
jgi:hypothetical protein